MEDGWCADMAGFDSLDHSQFWLIELGRGTRSTPLVVETMGLEPTTPCLQSRCSSQLSYVPEAHSAYAGRER